MADKKSGSGGLVAELPLDRLKEEAQDLVLAMGERGLARAGKSVDGLMDRLDVLAGGNVKAKAVKNVVQGDSPLKAGAKAVGSKVKDKVSNVLPGGRGGGDSGKKIKVTNIVESIDLPVSREVAYQQWTQFEDYPTFMKKVENVKQEEDEVLTWQAQIFWSHRSWKATIVDQVPNERVVWKSEGDKGHVDGAVTFHELAPNLTRVLVTLEYHPKGFFEHTANLWRAQGRRVRLELKHFRRYVATQTLLQQDELEGWKGEIHDEQVTSDGQSSDSSTRKTSRGGAKQSSSSRRSPSKRSSSGAGSTNRRSSAKKAPAKKAPAKKTAAKKTAAAQSSSRKATASKSTGSTARKSTTSGTAKKSTGRKSTAKKQGSSSRS